MALIVVRHHVRCPVGDAREYLSRLAASGGTVLVSVRISDGIERAHPVSIDERRPDGEGGSWFGAWNTRVGIPAAAGTLHVRADRSGGSMLEFHGSYVSPAFADETSHDVFAFRRASALARAYVETLSDNIEATAAA